MLVRISSGDNEQRMDIQTFIDLPLEPRSEMVNLYIIDGTNFPTEPGQLQALRALFQKCCQFPPVRIRLNFEMNAFDNFLTAAVWGLTKVLTQLPGFIQSNINYNELGIFPEILQILEKTLSQYFGVVEFGQNCLLTTTFQRYSTRNRLIQNCLQHVTLADSESNFEQKSTRSYEALEQWLEKNKPEGVERAYLEEVLHLLKLQIIISERELTAAILEDSIQKSFIHQDLQAIADCYFGTITTLKLHYDGLSNHPQALEVLRQKFPCLTKLVLSYNKLDSSSEDFRALAGILSQFSCFTILDLSYNNLGQYPAVLQVLAEVLPQFSHLTTLNLSGNKFGNNRQAFQTLAAVLPRLSHFTTLSLNDNYHANVPEVFLALIPSLSQLSHLTELDLSYNNLSQYPAVLQALAEVLPQLTHLTELNLSGNHFGSCHEAFLALVALLSQLSHLTTLSLNNNDLSNCPEALKALIEVLPRFFQFTTLNLSSNYFGSRPESLRILVKVLTKIPHLYRLDLSFNKFGNYPEAFQILEEALYKHFWLIDLGEYWELSPTLEKYLTRNRLIQARNKLIQDCLRYLTFDESTEDVEQKSTGSYEALKQWLEKNNPEGAERAYAEEVLRLLELRINLSKGVLTETELEKLIFQSFAYQDLNAIAKAHLTQPVIDHLMLSIHEFPDPVKHAAYSLLVYLLRNQQEAHEFRFGLVGMRNPLPSMQEVADILENLEPWIGASHSLTFEEARQLFNEAHQEGEAITMAQDYGQEAVHRLWQDPAFITCLSNKYPNKQRFRFIENCLLQEPSFHHEALEIIRSEEVQGKHLELCQAPESTTLHERLHQCIEILFTQPEENASAANTASQQTISSQAAHLRHMGIFTPVRDNPSAVSSFQETGALEEKNHESPVSHLNMG